MRCLTATKSSNPRQSGEHRDAIVSSLRGRSRALPGISPQPATASATRYLICRHESSGIPVRVSQDGVYSESPACHRRSGFFVKQRPGFRSRRARVRKSSRALHSCATRHTAARAEAAPVGQPLSATYKPLLSKRLREVAAIRGGELGLVP